LHTCLLSFFSFKHHNSDDQETGCREYEYLQFQAETTTLVYRNIIILFILIGIVVASITIRQYQTKHYENIKENLILSISSSTVSFDGEIYFTWLERNGYSTLNELLIKLSNVFNTDINLYSTSGFLIETSRHEIFDRDLTSERIIILALNNLGHLTKVNIIRKRKSESWSICLLMFHSSIQIIKLLLIWICPISECKVSWQKRFPTW